MKLEKLLSSPLSPIVAVSARERRRELGKLKNARLVDKRVKNKGLDLIYVSPATQGESKYDIHIHIEKDDIKVYCSCPAYELQGFKYRCYARDAGIEKETREDLRWKRYHGAALFCKHLDLLFKNSLTLKEIKTSYEKMKEK